MSTIRETLRSQMTTAMKAGDTPTVNVIRQIESEIGVARSAPGFTGEIDDELYQTTIASYVKKMDRARAEFAALGERGAGQVEKLEFEIEYLSKWLPESVGEEQTAQIVDAVIAELGATDPKMKGRVIGQVMKSGKNLDGALVNRLVSARFDHMG